MVWSWEPWRKPNRRLTVDVNLAAEDLGRKKYPDLSLTCPCVDNFFPRGEAGDRHDRGAWIAALERELCLKLPGNQNATCRGSCLGNDTVQVCDGVFSCVVFCHAAIKRSFHPQMGCIEFSQVIKGTAYVLQSDFVHVQIGMIGMMLQHYHHILVSTFDGQG